MLSFATNASVVTRPVQVRRAPALCPLAGLQGGSWFTANALGRGSGSPLPPPEPARTARRALTSAQADFNCSSCKGNKFCSSICREEGKTTLPEQAGTVSDTAMGYGALPAQSAGTESRAPRPAPPLHPGEQHST